jgi:DNA-binding response OmpR family regulator
MLALLVEPDPDFAALLSFLLEYAGHTVQVQPAVGDPLAVTAVPLLVLRADLPAPARATLRQLIAARGAAPTLLLTSAPDPAAVAATLGVPVAHCFGLPLVPAALRACLARLQPAAGSGEHTDPAGP